MSVSACRTRICYPSWSVRTIHINGWNWILRFQSRNFMGIVVSIVWRAGVKTGRFDKFFSGCNYWLLNRSCYRRLWEHRSCWGCFCSCKFFGKREREVCYSIIHAIWTCTYIQRKWIEVLLLNNLDLLF